MALEASQGNPLAVEGCLERCFLRAIVPGLVHGLSRVDWLTLPNSTQDAVLRLAQGLIRLCEALPTIQAACEPLCARYLSQRKEPVPCLWLLQATAALFHHAGERLFAKESAAAPRGQEERASHGSWIEAPMPRCLPRVEALPALTAPPPWRNHSSVTAY